MKRIKINEQWCLGCHLCEFWCGYKNSGVKEFADAYKLHSPVPRVRVESGDNISYAVNCRHCEDALCVKSCIAGAISRVDGVVKIDDSKCVGCHTCVLVCPFGALRTDSGKPVLKCELCTRADGEPECVKHCPNAAIVLEDV